MHFYTLFFHLNLNEFRGVGPAVNFPQTLANAILEHKFLLEHLQHRAVGQVSVQYTGFPFSGICAGISAEPGFSWITIKETR